MNIFGKLLSDKFRTQWYDTLLAMFLALLGLITYHATVQMPQYKKLV